MICHMDEKTLKPSTQSSIRLVVQLFLSISRLYPNSLQVTPPHLLPYWPYTNLFTNNTFSFFLTTPHISRKIFIFKIICILTIELCTCTYFFSRDLLYRSWLGCVNYWTKIAAAKIDRPSTCQIFFDCIFTSAIHLLFQNGI